MAATRPAPGELDPIETASRDEIQALQLQGCNLVAAGSFNGVEFAWGGHGAAFGTASVLAGVLAKSTTGLPLMV